MHYAAANDAILEHIDQLRIVDTHEHLPNEDRAGGQPDVLNEWLMHYFSCDLVSAGLTGEDLARARDAGRPLPERWAIVEPYWEAARSTGYGRALEQSARGLYGIERIDRRTIEALDAAVRDRRRRGGHYEYVLKERSRIALSLVDTNLECDRRYFASVARVHELVAPFGRQQLLDGAARFGIRLRRLEDFDAYCERWVEDAVARGAVGLKSALAYERSLHFPVAGRADAERDLLDFLTSERSVRGASAWPGACLQDYAMHRILSLADERGLAFQFHTGLQEGNGNYLRNVNPVLLTDTLLRYPNVRFDLFHMGYPYMLELSALAKNFRNVFIDMCWGHIISPEAARRALVEWLDAVPANKISAFGGDYLFVDGVYGHQCLARRNVAASLATKVADGSFDLDRARQIATWLFVDNPVRLFGLTDRITAANPSAAS